MPSILHTDAYKFSMAEAGFPLREEEFYYTHRKGGWQYLPFDPGETITAMLPTVFDSDIEWLRRTGYEISEATKQALRGAVRVRGLPRGSWFYQGEPVFSIIGPSALVSWLEPTVIQLHARIQAATLFLLHGGVVARATCGDEAAMLSSMYVDLRAPDDVRWSSEEYADHVRARGTRAVNLVGDPRRLFEVGMRAASCQEQHQLAMQALASVGIDRTSNVRTARALNLTPVGTMGHEHIQRFGSSLRAFEAMRDRVTGPISYLPDTFSTLDEGVPAAIRVMQDAPRRLATIRFDAEKYAHEHYVATVCKLRARDLEPNLAHESGYDDTKIDSMEELRRAVNWPAEKQSYGVGGWFMAPPWVHFRRDDVAAVYKLSWSGRPVRKLGDEPGSAKASIPGKPVLWRGHLGEADYQGPVGWVCQEGEDWTPPRASQITDVFDLPRWLRFDANDIRDIQKRHEGNGLQMSPGTIAAVESCRREREAAFEAVREGV